MKLPFHKILGPMLKPYLTSSKLFCRHPTFSCISAHHLKKHIGVVPFTDGGEKLLGPNRSSMIAHDLKVIVTSMGLIQYTCLLIGCITENPALFLPHLSGQIFVVGVKILNACLFLLQINWKSLNNFRQKMTAILLMTFNWLQEFCVFRQYLCVYQWSFFNISPHGRYRYLYRYITWRLKEVPSLMRSELSITISRMNATNVERSDGLRVKLRALLVALLGISMSACAFASQPVELEMDDDEVTNKLNNVSFARRITKPTIRLVMGYGKLSAFVTATTSILLLIAVMSKQSWWRRGARWLAAPALLVAALEAASDASDALLAAVLRGTSDPLVVLAQTTGACLLITVEILVWYFIAKFFEYNPPQPAGLDEKESTILPNITNVQ